jgi:hypothetical protein
MINTNSYKPREFNLSGLNGISDQTLEMHFKLYEGYVQYPTSTHVYALASHFVCGLTTELVRRVVLKAP